jgi:hypothetical protein
VPIFYRALNAFFQEAVFVVGNDKGNNGHPHFFQAVEYAAINGLFFIRGRALATFSALLLNISDMLMPRAATPTRITAAINLLKEHIRWPRRLPHHL